MTHPARAFLLMIVTVFSAATLANKPVDEENMPLQLASQYSDSIDIQNYLVSEKLDGVRARWTGTELKTRNGNKIHAPEWFTANWPAQTLDGELWTKRDDFQRIASVVLRDTPDERWKEVSTMVFDVPGSTKPFAERVILINKLVASTNSITLKAVPHEQIATAATLEQRLDEVVNAGGEGLMLHHRQALYKDGRSELLLKLKRHEDDEAKVIGYVAGKGKYAGLTGSLIVQSRDGLTFKIGSGLSDADRASPPPVGSWITYKFYGRTQKGLPRFASFMRVRPDKDMGNHQ